VTVNSSFSPHQHRKRAQHGCDVKLPTEVNEQFEGPAERRERGQQRRDYEARECDA